MNSPMTETPSAVAHAMPVQRPAFRQVNFAVSNLVGTVGGCARAVWLADDGRLLIGGAVY